MNREELKKKIKVDLRWDKFVTFFSIAVFVTAFYAWAHLRVISVEIMLIAGINFMIWLNSVLITKRNVQMMEVKK